MYQNKAQPSYGFLVLYLDMNEDRSLTFFQESHVDHVSDLLVLEKPPGKQVFPRNFNYRSLPPSTRNQVERVTQGANH